jgi:hypothetical protein
MTSMNTIPEAFQWHHKRERASERARCGALVKSERNEIESDRNDVVLSMMFLCSSSALVFPAGVIYDGAS